MLKKNPSQHKMCWDIEKGIPFKSKTFDSISLIFVSNYIKNLKNLYKECSRVLKKNGKLIIVQTNLGKWYKRQGIRTVEETIEKEPEKQIEVELPEKADDKVTYPQEAQPPAEKIITISDEKIESILTMVVKDVVERVVRETMAEVAEKVIREAIDALKESLEKASE